MRYLASAAAHSGVTSQELVTVEVEITDEGDLDSQSVRRSRMRGTLSAAASLFTVILTSSEPARASSATWRTVAVTSAVSVLVIDCTTMGDFPPTVTRPIRTATVGRRVEAG